MLRKSLAPRDRLWYCEDNMNLVGVVCTDEKINETVQDELDTKFSGGITLRFPDPAEVMEFLNFDLPEIIIFNFTDPGFDAQEIVSQIRGDAWLHNFGIIGLYDQEHNSEESLLALLKNINVLALLNSHRIKSHIAKSIDIIDANRQIIFQSEISNRFFERASGSFTLDNDILASSIYANILATTVAQRGYVTPERKMHLQLALAELLINAIEHGNCGISYEEKTAYLERGVSIIDLVAEKTQDETVACKQVHFDYDIRSDATRFVIRDEGDGFDVLALSEKLRTEGEMSLHGRGIRMAASLAAQLTYNKKGNVVKLVFPHDEQVVRDTPVGFTQAEELTVRSGDIIFHEGESSNFIYYIAGGTYSVFHNKRHVGMISPADIFMGEMSFLLNNRRSATVRSEGDGKLLKISRRDFISVIKDYPHYGIFVAKLLAQKLVRANVRNAVLQQRNAGAGRKPVNT